MHPHSDIRLDPCLSRIDTVAYCPPVDILIERNGCLRHPADHPCNLVIEVFGEPALAVLPGYILG